MCRQAVIHVNDARVRLGEGEARDESFIQDGAQRTWLCAQFNELTGRDYRVLLFPGWFVERSTHTITLSEADQRLVTYHLSCFVRMS